METKKGHVRVTNKDLFFLLLKIEYISLGLH